ncbi:coiled-coil domain-containing protein 12 isoform X1 [Heterocephalus glaber]|uniref:Coiled-coil domain-containing protein 12 isoform X1 n=1 Tax=Heterocephalus glaber TaxID=10181 RepID=A0AAX6SWC8_HETGA|nr:coiled-coil domain-containing protein 12 isoform X1 [Heterocephalus glaber]
MPSVDRQLLEDTDSSKLPGSGPVLETLFPITWGPEALCSTGGPYSGLVGRMGNSLTGCPCALPSSLCPSPGPPTVFLLEIWVAPDSCFWVGVCKLAQCVLNGCWLSRFLTFPCPSSGRPWEHQLQPAILLKSPEGEAKDKEDGEPKIKQLREEEEEGEKHRELRLRNYVPEDEDLKRRRVPQAKPVADKQLVWYLWFSVLAEPPRTSYR